MFKNILVAIDHGTPAAHELRTAVELSEKLDAQLTILHVVDTGPAFNADTEFATQQYLEKQRKAGEALLKRAIVSLPEEAHARPFIAEGDPAEMILNAAGEWPAELIVIGSDSRGRLAHFLLGSTADAVIRKAACPVMSVRAHANVREVEPALAKR